MLETMAFPRFSEETFLKDITKWIETGGSAGILHPESGWSLLHFAAEFQDVAAIEYLINSGCALNLRDKDGQTPLHIAIDSEIDAAIQNGESLEYRATRRLVELGADTTIQDSRGESPIA